MSIKYKDSIPIMMTQNADKKREQIRFLCMNDPEISQNAEPVPDKITSPAPDCHKGLKIVRTTLKEETAS